MDMEPNSADDDHAGSPMNEDAEDSEENLSDEDNHGQEGGDGFYEVDIADEQWNFAQVQEDEQHLSLAEIAEAIEDTLGPGMDLEMYNLSNNSPFNFNDNCFAYYDRRKCHHDRAGSHQCSRFQAKANV